LCRGDGGFEATAAYPPKNGSSDEMTTRRADAIADLFATLEGLLITYQALPECERVERWAADAHHITGVVARQLSSTRTRISSGAVPLEPPGPGLFDLGAAGA
jgi:hypothetical protein